MPGPSPLDPLPVRVPFLLLFEFYTSVIHFSENQYLTIKGDYKSCSQRYRNEQDDFLHDLVPNPTIVYDKWNRMQGIICKQDIFLLDSKREIKIYSGKDAERFGIVRTLLVGSTDYPQATKSTYYNSFNDELDPPIEEFSPITHDGYSMEEGNLTSSHQAAEKQEKYHFDEDLKIDEDFEEDIPTITHQSREPQKPRSFPLEECQHQEYSEDR